MTAFLDALDEVDAIEALAEPTAADLARLDVLAAGTDSFVAGVARVARSTVARRIRDAVILPP